MKRGLKILLISDSIANLATGMIGPIYAIFVEQIGGGILEASWTFFAYNLSAGIVMYLLSILENYIKHKEKIVFYGYALTSLGCFSYIFVYNWWTLFFTQVIL